MTREQVQAGARERESDFQGFLAELGDESAQRSIEVLGSSSSSTSTTSGGQYQQPRKINSGTIEVLGGSSTTTTTTTSASASASGNISTAITSNEPPADVPMYTGRAGPAFSIKPCFKYQKGECHRGDQCRYSHSGPGGSSTGNSGGYRGVPPPSINFQPASNGTASTTAPPVQEVRRINSGPIEVLGVGAPPVNYNAPANKPPPEILGVGGSGGPPEILGVGGDDGGRGMNQSNGMLQQGGVGGSGGGGGHTHPAWMSHGPPPLPPPPPLLVPPQQQQHVSVYGGGGMQQHHPQQMWNSDNVRAVAREEDVDWD